MEAAHDAAAIVHCSHATLADTLHPICTVGEPSRG